MAFRPDSLTERLRLLQSRDQHDGSGLFVKDGVTKSPFCRQIVRFEPAATDAAESSRPIKSVRQQLLDDGGNGAAVGLAGEGLVGSAHHLAHILDGRSAHLGDDGLHLCLDFGL